MDYEIEKRIKREARNEARKLASGLSKDKVQELTLKISKKIESDNPRKAGGLMSGAASKAVDPLAKRRAEARLSYQIQNSPPAPSAFS
jgi:hypothetical protein